MHPTPLHWQVASICPPPSKIYFSSWVGGVTDTTLQSMGRERGIFGRWGGGGGGGERGGRWGWEELEKFPLSDRVRVCVCSDGNARSVWGGGIQFSRKREERGRKKVSSIAQGEGGG